MLTKPIIGCVQLNSQSDIDANLTTIETSIQAAAKLGVHLLVLPENACRMGNQHELSERFEALSDWYADLAFKHQLFIVAGTLPCPYRPDGKPVPNAKLRQVSQLFAPDGKRLARYDKIHLFKAQVADSTGSYDEGQTFEAGDTTVVAQCDMRGLIGAGSGLSESSRPLTVGMMVCFDLRFAALAQRLRQAGAELLTAPSAFTYQTGQAHWQLLLQARALDAQCMVVGAAQGGEHRYPQAKNRKTWGHSAITNANGEVVVQTNRTSVTNLLDSAAIAKQVGPDSNSNSDSNTDTLQHQHYELISCDFDLQTQQDWRQNMPIHHCHRLA